MRGIVEEVVAHERGERLEALMGQSAPPGGLAAITFPPRGGGDPQPGTPTPEQHPRPWVGGSLSIGRIPPLRSPSWPPWTFVPSPPSSQATAAPPPPLPRPPPLRAECFTESGIGSTNGDPRANFFSPRFYRRLNSCNSVLIVVDFTVAQIRCTSVIPFNVSGGICGASQQWPKTRSPRNDKAMQENHRIPKIHF